MQHLSKNLQGYSVLITGGAGYIGRVATLMLEHWGCTVWCLDDLSGSRAPNDTTRFVKGSILDTELLTALFERHQFDAVIHLAGKINVGESVHSPDLYWLHNVVGTQKLLSCMPKDTNLIFASSAAVYGSCADRVTETAICTPTSPYGHGKLTAEQAISACPNNSICFRLFNVAGAIPHPFHPALIVGEEHHPETHLIPRVIQQHLNGQPFSVYGNSHDTQDGTCIREYIHVLDVVRAFTMGLVKLATTELEANKFTFNLSSGVGHSVLDVLNAISREGQLLEQLPIDYYFAPPRDGDPSRIAGNISRIRNTLNWTPMHSDLSWIARSTWQHQLMLRQRTAQVQTVAVTENK